MARKPKSSPACNRSPLRPDWRWAEGQVRAQDTDDRVVASDPLVAEIAAHLRARGDSLQPSGNVGVALAAVEAIQRDPKLSSMLKLLVIADTPRNEIVRQTQLDLECLRLWEDIFFDVRERLDARGWLVNVVIAGEVEAGNQQLAEKLNVAAHGGPAVALLLVNAESGLAAAPDDELLLLRLRFQLRLRRALQAPLRTATQAAKFIDSAVALERVAAEYTLAKERLASQERQAERLHREYMQRLQTAHVDAITRAYAFGLVADLPSASDGQETRHFSPWSDVQANTAAPLGGSEQCVAYALAAGSAADIAHPGSSPAYLGDEPETEGPALVSFPWVACSGPHLAMATPATGSWNAASPMNPLDPGWKTQIQEST